jgi:Zn-dependent peptidase ImmA (M78 family)
MKTKIPVNPAILKWARLSLKLSPGEVARRLQKSEEDIIAWEEGRDSPTYVQLENLAYNVYKRPVAVFFFPDVPEEDTPQADFRTLPESVVEDLPPELIKMYRKAKVYQINLSELYDHEPPAEQSILQNRELSFSTDVLGLVGELRRFLDVDIHQQIEWSGYDDALKTWRERFEKHGLFVFKDAFKNDDYSGFCLYHDLYPVIFVNNSLPKSRQIFTLFHELAHLLFKSGGIDIQARGFFRKLSGDYSRLEVKCNEFAGEMLLPTDFLKREALAVDEQTVASLAQKFKVSREVILRKYLDLSLIDEDQYRDWADQWIAEAKKRKEEQTPGGDYYYTQKAYLGDTYVNLAFSKYFKNQITAENLADYLGMSVQNIGQ